MLVLPPGTRATPQRAAVLDAIDAEAVDKRVDRHCPGAECTDVRVRARLLGRVAVVQHEHALGEEERQESRPDEQADAMGVTDDLDRLRQHMKDRDCDDDSACQGDRGPEITAEPQRRDAAGEGCRDG